MASNDSLVCNTVISPKTILVNTMQEKPLYLRKIQSLNVQKKIKVIHIIVQKSKRVKTTINGTGYNPVIMIVIPVVILNCRPWMVKLLFFALFFFSFGIYFQLKVWFFSSRHKNKQHYFWECYCKLLFDKWEKQKMDFRWNCLLGKIPAVSAGFYISSKKV